MVETVVALLMLVNNEIKEHRIQPAMSDCLKGKRIAERQLIEEEDIELYTPIIATLKQDYLYGLQNSGLIERQSQGGK